MKKTIILSFLLIVASLFTLETAAASFDFTYANGDISTYGRGKKETIDVAMRIDDPSLAGMKIVGVKAYVSAPEVASDAKIWLSNDLVLEDGKNVADIANYDAEVSSAALEGAEYGAIEYQFSDPYVLTGAPVYVGYSFTVENNLTESQKKPIVVSSGVNENGFFLHMSKSVLKWMNYSEAAKGVAYIVVELEGNLSQNALGLNGYETIYANDNEDFQATFSVQNMGQTTIENVIYSYSYDNGETFEGYQEFLSPIRPSLTNETTMWLEFKGVTGYGPHDLNLTVTKVNGEANEAPNSSITAVVNVIPFVPDHRPLVEEFTGLWCGWCPRGYIAMEMIGADYGEEEVSICYHNGDPMEATDEFPIDVKGLPAACIDRLEVIDPYYGSVLGAEFGISRDLLNTRDQLAIASIDVKGALEGNDVNVETVVTFIRDIDEADYEVGYVLVANGLSNPDWYQSNYFAGAAGYAGTCLEVLTTWPDRVEGLIFNDVAVDAAAMEGVAGSLPESIKTNETYTHNYTIDIAGNTIIQDKQNLVVTAFVIDKSTGKIVNANKSAVNTAGVHGIGVSSETVSSEYYDLTGVKVNNPGKGLFIKVEKYSDGKSKASKILRSGRE